jgi:hypothetical protein
MIVQRCLYFAVAAMSCWSVWRALNDERVRALMTGTATPHRGRSRVTSDDMPADKAVGASCDMV